MIIHIFKSVYISIYACIADRQCHLDKEGAADLVVDLILNNHSTRIFRETLELGIALLDGGNSDVQVRTTVSHCRWEGCRYGHGLTAVIQ